MYQVLGARAEHLGEVRRPSAEYLAPELGAELKAERIIWRVKENILHEVT